MYNTWSNKPLVQYLSKAPRRCRWSDKDIVQSGGFTPDYKPDGLGMMRKCTR